MSPVPLRCARRCVLVLTLIGLVLPVLGGAPAAAATSPCVSHPSTGYTVDVCLVDVPDGPLAGEVAVNATVTVRDPAPGVVLPAIEKVVFWFNGEYLLSDHDPAYGMTWRTQRHVDSTGPLRVRARLMDGTSYDLDQPVTLANGVTVPAVNTQQFSVARGSSPEPGQRFRLAAVGDGASGSPEEAAVVQQIASWKPNLLAYLGDVYERGSTHEFDNWYGSPTGYGRFRDITNPVVGNHEYLTPGAAGYFDYWDNIPHYYSYDVAGWHVAAIDSSVEFGQLQPGTPQYDWLAGDLAANRARCTIVYMHHPRYSVAQGGGRTGLGQVWSLLAARRVTLAVAGHAHSYERWAPLNGTGSPDPQGVTQLVAGTGGHEFVPGVLSDTRLASAAAVPGALRLDLGSEDVSFGFVDTAGQVLDGGTIGCKSTGDTLPPTTPSGLLASATSSSTASLSWQPSTDQYTAVAGYTVRRDGAVVATLGAGSTTYADNGLVSGTTYSWTVDAFDTSANVSPQSVPAAVTMPAPPPPKMSTRAMLRDLHRAPETPRGYQRSKFRMWTDADGDGCSTRNEVLVAEASRPPTVRAGCGLTGGRWFSRYDGVVTTDRSRLGIEHVVPLGEVWRSGARRWTATTRQQMANDLGYAATLAVATKRVLRSRGNAEPQDWMPQRPATRCGYVSQWVAVKWRWRLAVDPAERRFLVNRLSACGWPTVVKPTRPTITRR